MTRLNPLKRRVDQAVRAALRQNPKPAWVLAFLRMPTGGGFTQSRNNGREIILNRKVIDPDTGAVSYVNIIETL